MSFTFGNKTWIFLNLNHLLVAGSLSLSHVVLLSPESSMVQSVWGSVLWSLVYTGHCNVVIVQVSMFSLRQEKLFSPLGSSLVSSLSLVQSAGTVYSEPHLRKKSLPADSVPQRSFEFSLLTKPAKPCSHEISVLGGGCINL